MKSVREIIKEACTRINLVPRKQAVPGDILENAYDLLKGIANKYNKDNLLSWTQNSIILENKSLIHIYDETDVLKGEFNLYFNTSDELNEYPLTQEDIDNDVWAISYDTPNTVFKPVNTGTEEEPVFTWEPTAMAEPYSQRYQEMLRYKDMWHVQIRDVNKINSIYVITVANEPYREICKLDFINHTDYDRYGISTKTFTYTHKSEGEWLIEIKPLIARQNYRLKMNYNEGIKFDLDTDLYIPDNYIELLIVALAHELAIMYPRLDETQMARLQNEVAVLVDNVRTPNSTDRILLREDYWKRPRRMSQAELESGSWVY